MEMYGLRPLLLLQPIRSLPRLDQPQISLTTLLMPSSSHSHLGSLGGVRGSGVSNIQGVLVSEVIDRCDFNAVSLGSIATGSIFTYASGDTQTIYLPTQRFISHIMLSYT